MLQSSAVHLQELGGALPTGFLPTPEDLLSSLWSWMHSWELEGGSLKRGRMEIPCLSHIQLANNTILGTSKSPLQHPARAWLRNFPSAWNVDPWATKRRVHQQNQSSGEMMTMMRPWLQLLANARFRHIELRFCKLEFFTDAITNNIDSATSITNTSTLNKKLRSTYALVFWETSQWQAKRKKDSIVFNQRDPCASTARKCKYVEQHATISWYIVCTSWIIASSDEKNLCAAERAPVLTDWSAKPYNTVSFFWRSPKDRSKTDRCGRDWKTQLTKSCTEDDYISLTSNRFARSTIVTTNVFPSHRRTHIVSKHLRPPVSTRSEFHDSFWLQ